jgi:membrane protein DedA with SNARE-associated domain
MAFFAPLLAFLQSSKYALIFIGCYLEGSTVMMTTGLLWRTGVVAFWPAYATLVVADVLSDIMWYFLGYYAARPLMNRWGHWFGITPEIVEKVKRRFHHYHIKILAISKLTMGFGFAVPVLAVAGMLHVPLGRFVLINSLGSLVWVLANMAVGYYFGNFVVAIPREFQIALLIALPVLFFLGIQLLTRKLKEVDW